MTRIKYVVMLLCCGIGLSAATVKIGDNDFFAEISLDSGGVVFWGSPGCNLVFSRPEPVRSVHGSWMNYGGDWVWTSLQSTWPFLSGGELVPPEGNGKWILGKQDDNSVSIVNPEIKSLVIRVERFFTISPRERKLTVVNTVTRLAASPQSIHVWSVTQLPSPDYCLLDVAWAPRNMPSYAEISRPHRVSPEDCPDLNGVRYFDGKKVREHAKIGTLGNWVAAVYLHHVILQSSSLAMGECYPELSSVQVYANHEYTELEVLSQNRHLKPGESICQQVSWLYLPLNAAQSPWKTARWLKRISSEDKHYE